MATEERPWLSKLKDDIYRSTTAAAVEFWPPRGEEPLPYFNFRLEHILQVERDALRITKVEHGDEEVVLAAVWVHDRFQPQFGGKQHAASGARWALDHLASLGFPAYKVPQVSQAIALHSRHTMDIPSDCREARILWDADHVARTGPVDLLHYVLCHSAEDFLQGLPANNRFPSGSINIRDFLPMLMERRPQLYRMDWFYFDETRRMARDRMTASRMFLDSLEDQVLARTMPRVD